jgi:branched-chain amino acid transport system permease protein
LVKTRIPLYGKWMSITTLLIQYFFSGLTLGGIYGLIAIGFTIIFNVSKAFNFIQGEFAMLSALTTVFLLTVVKLPMAAAFICSIILVGLVAAFFEKIFIRPAMRSSHIVIILITVGGSVFFQGIAALLWGKQIHSFEPILGNLKSINFLGASLSPQALFILGTTALISLLLKIFFDSTLFGKAMIVCSESHETAQILGIRVERMIAVSFVLSGSLGAIGGLLITPMSSIDYQAGVMLTVKGIFAAVIGGMGNLWGALIGGLTLGILESFSAGLISSQYKEAITFMAFMLILFIRPSGILGEK